LRTAHPAGGGDPHPAAGRRGGEPVGADAARALYRRALAADKQLLIVPGGGHGSSLLESATAAPRVRAAVRRFVADHARP
jgi:hypothetical protein